MTVPNTSASSSIDVLLASNVLSVVTLVSVYDVDNAVQLPHPVADSVVPDIDNQEPSVIAAISPVEPLPSNCEADNATSL